MLANEVIIHVKANTDKAERGFKSFSQKVSKSLSSIRLPLLAVGGAIAGLGVIGIKAASDLDEAMNKAMVTFGDASDVVRDFAATSADSFGLSKAAAFEYSGTLGTILNASGLAATASAGMSVELLKLAADLASFNNIPIDQALEKLRSGLVGEVEPLRTVGVLLNQTAVAAEALALGLVGANGVLTEADKVQARYSVIMQQTAAQRGDFARTSDSLANATRRLQAKLTDLSAELGEVLLPAAEKVVSKLIEFTNVVKELPGPVKTGTVVIGGIASSLAAIGLAIPPLLVGFRLLASPIGLAVVVLAALVTAGFFLVREWAKFTELMVWYADQINGALTAMVNAAIFAVSKLTWLLNKLIPAFHDTIPEIKKVNIELGKLVGLILGKVEKTFKALFDRTVKVTEGGLSPMEEELERLSSWGFPQLTDAVDETTEGLKSLQDEVQATMRQVAGMEHIFTDIEIAASLAARGITGHFKRSAKEFVEAWASAFNWYAAASGANAAAPQYGDPIPSPPQEILDTLPAGEDFPGQPGGGKKDYIFESEIPKDVPTGASIFINIDGQVVAEVLGVRASTEEQVRSQ